MSRYLFLDIDGVLNDEAVQFPNGYHGTDWKLVQRLNRVIRATDPAIVVSSAWHRDVLRGDITLAGFETMLARHGIDCCGHLVGVTEADHYAVSRGELISMWLDKHARPRDRYVILDDGAYWLPGQEDHGIRAAGHSENFVQTNSRTGLTDRDVSKAISILNGKAAPALIRS